MELGHMSDDNESVVEVNAEASRYITFDKDTNTWIATEEAYIGDDLLDSVEFKFDFPQNITENKNRRTTDKAKEDAKKVNLDNNIVFYGAGKVQYPDNAVSEITYLTDCIIQYKPSIEDNNNKYGLEYITVGIPEKFINKAIKDAKAHGIKVVLKKNAIKEDRYCWLSCDLKKLEKGNTAIVSEDANGDLASVPIELSKVFESIKRNFLCNIGFSMSIYESFKDDGKTQGGSGPYIIGFKLKQVLLREVAKLKGPEIVTNEQRKNTTMTYGGKFVATGLLAELANSISV